MLRTQHLFAFTTIGLLALGLLASQFGSQPHLTIQAGAQNRGYAFSSEMPFYCIAALFGLFAFLYSIGYIPFNSTMARLHFWLSLISVAVCIAGAAIFSWYVEYAERTKIVDTELGTSGMLLAASFAAGLLTFVSMQLWFAVDLARALFKMHTA
jgi:hypothetical protein